jgi:UrcA family protein
MMFSATKSISPWFFAVGLAAVASGALAGEQPGRSLDPVVTVHFADLNTSSRDSRILYERIAKAAQDVCNAQVDWYPSEYWSHQECYRATVDHVVAKLNLPALTALHVARTHRTGSSFQASNK